MNQTPHIQPYAITESQEISARSIPLSAAGLGYAGLIPFALCTIVLAWDKPTWQPVALEAFITYSAIILSFLGGIRWGAASSGRQARSGALAFSVLPSLWAALILLWPNEYAAVWGLMVGFVLMGMADWFRPVPKMPAWMRTLRLHLSVAVLACHCAVLTLI